MKQVHITIGSSSGRGKTSTAIEMFAQNVCKPDMQLFFLSDEMTAPRIYERVKDILGDLLVTSAAPGRIMTCTNEINASELMSELFTLLETVDESKHVYIVLDLMTIAPVVYKQNIEYIRGMLHKHQYTIVTTQNTYKPH